MSDRRTRAVMAALAGLGLAISAYLTWAHYADAEPFCTGISDCTRVQTSDYAAVAGIPVALIGVAGYLGLLATLALRAEASVLAGAFRALVGAGFSGSLSWVEAARVEAFCQWCVVSAVLMIALAALAARRLLHA